MGKIIIAATLVLSLAACGGRQADDAAPDNRPNAEVTLPLSSLLVLEYWGAPPGDSTVTLSTGGARTVVLRHGPPDLTVFAELALPAPAAGAMPGDSVALELTTRPGTYGLTIASNPPLGPGAVLRFKYPVHFSAPAAALERYGNIARYERALAIALRLPDGRYRLLPSVRPIADVLETTIPGAGSYLVAAPR